jgi:hypothetical protein
MQRILMKQTMQLRQRMQCMRFRIGLADLRASGIDAQLVEPGKYAPMVPNPDFVGGL